MDSMMKTLRAPQSLVDRVEAQRQEGESWHAAALRLLERGVEAQEAPKLEDTLLDLQGIGHRLIALGQSMKAVL